MKERDTRTAIVNRGDRRTWEDKTLHPALEQRPEPAIYARLDLDPVRQAVNTATAAMLAAGGLGKRGK